MQYDDDWEKRKDKIPLNVHIVGNLSIMQLFIAGCTAGLIEHVSMLPLDNIKTHLQVLPDTKFFKIVKTLQSHGLKSYFYGYGAVTFGCMPAHALYFSSYEILKLRLNVADENLHPITFATIGAISSFWHDLIMVPFDVIKQRQQILEIDFKNTLHSIVKKEGIFALYRSFPITQFMSAPYQAIFFASNESINTLINRKYQPSFASHFISASISSALAVLAMNPLDVIKTKLQTQTCFLNQSQIKYKTASQTIKVILKEEGLKGFYRGLLPRLCIQTLSSSTAWATYEFVKQNLMIYQI